MKLITPFMTLFFISFNAWSGTHEKALTWSGRWAALGGAASSFVTGADGVFFNPAGIVKEPAKEISLNFSPTWSQSKLAEQNSQGDNTISDPSSPFFAALYSQPISQNFSLAMGAYTAGQSNITASPRDKFHLKTREISLAASYQISPHFSLGASWRGLKASGQLTQLHKNDNSFSTEINYPDLQSKLSHGFRLGFQYQNKKRTLGGSFVLRSPVSFKLKSQLVGILHPPANIQQGPLEQSDGKDVQLETSLPSQFVFGVFWKPDAKKTLLHETAFSHSSRNRDIKVTNQQIHFPNYQTESYTTSPIILNWRNRWDLKFGYQHQLTDQATWRLGYAFNTSVASQENTGTLSPSPTGTHNFSTGWGYMIIKDHFFLEAALERSMTMEQSYEAGSSNWTIHSSLRYLL